MLGACAGSDGLDVLAAGGIDGAASDRDRVATALDDAHGLPWLQAFGDLFGIGLGIARNLKRFKGEDGGGVVMAVVATLRRGGELRGDHIGSENANDSNYIAENLLVVPKSKRLIEALRVTEIDRPSEKLPRTIEPAPRQ